MEFTLILKSLLGETFFRYTAPWPTFYRQSLYAVRAAQIGLAEGVTWLLHIDADELFYDSNAEELDGSAAKVFEALSRKEFTHASFFNDEILPESASYTDKKQLLTPFHQRTLFKV